MRLHVLGRACLALGRLDEARSLGERAVKSSPHQPGYAAHAWHLLGDVAALSDPIDPERGLACYKEALARAEPRGMLPLIAHCHLGIGRVQRRMGLQDLAREHVARAATMYHDMGHLGPRRIEQRFERVDLPDGDRAPCVSRRGDPPAGAAVDAYDTTQGSPRAFLRGHCRPSVLE
jgi:tetratricopeptide (TPR) repeat protein